MSKILGIDWGSRRVGLAVTDSAAKLAQPLPSLPSTANLIEQIKQLCQQEGVGTLVVGLPRGLDGQDTPQTVQVRQFAAKLAVTTKIPLKLQDEGLTSVTARQAEPPPVDVDSAAASLILNDYLAGQ